jgi:hypothetical protein
MSKNYGIFHISNIQQNNTDIISLEQACPDDMYNKTQSISYLVLDVNKRPIKINYWKLESAKLYFIDNKNIRDPETRLIIPLVFIKRLQQQLELENDYKQPTQEWLNEKFIQYLENPETLSDHDMIILKNFLHPDDHILSEWHGMEANSIELRDKAIQSIDSAENGSWLLRDSSIKNSDIINVKVITIKTKEGEVCHMPVAHAYGYGYFFPNVSRGYIMPDIGSGNVFPDVLFNQVFPSFIDLLEYGSELFNFDKNKMIRNLLNHE